MFHSSEYHLHTKIAIDLECAQETQVIDLKCVNGYNQLIPLLIPGKGLTLFKMLSSIFGTRSRAYGGEYRNQC